jgi:lipopolysaccharide biosynthesis glycosyltransferase
VTGVQTCALPILISLLYNAKEKCCYDIYCVVDKNVETLDKNKIKDIVNRVSPSSTIHFVSAGNVFDSSKTGAWYTKSIYFRLLLPELLPEIDKIIYLDTDLIVLHNLCELYNNDLGDNMLAACLDTINIRVLWYGYGYANCILPVKRRQYINSGVLIMNLKELRQNTLKEQWLKLSSEKLLQPDQDILNHTCEGKILFLPIKYNYNIQWERIWQAAIHECLFSEEEYIAAKNNPTIYHYIGKDKPWNSNCPHVDLWREYANMLNC